MAFETESYRSAAPAGVSEREVRRFLERVREAAGADCATPVAGSAVGDALGLSRETTYRLVDHLSARGYLHYVGTGPRVCITARGLEWLSAAGSRATAQMA